MLHAVQIILAREYLKDVSVSREQLKYLVMEALRGGCQVLIMKHSLIYIEETLNKIVKTYIPCLYSFISMQGHQCDSFMQRKMTMYYAPWSFDQCEMLFFSVSPLLSYV